MASEVDERIVEAKFDASDFEKGVNKTIKKLDELKASLNLKDGTKNITELADKTKEAAEKGSQSLEKLTDRFTTFIGMIKTKFLGSLADQVVGVFMRMEQSVLGFFKSIGSQQMYAGMEKYTGMLSNVRTMMAAANGKFSMDEAYAAIDELGNFADQTSYRLEHMTDAMSKMVAAGVDLDSAKRNVQGIATAAAVAGVNANDASRAYFNLAQAYSSGYLKYTDYRSLQLLNMTNENFENQLLEAAVKRGTLKKTGEGQYVTVKKGKTVGGKKVNRQNLADSLKYNFVDTDVMDELFGNQYYIKDANEFAEEMAEITKKYTDQDLSHAEARTKAIEELSEKYGKVKVEAFLAAQEARSFTDVMDTLKDVVSRGWSKTFELLFGKLDEATSFFTSLTESNLFNIIYSIGDWRNKMLEVWGTTASGSGKSGRDYLLESWENVDSIIGKIHETLTQFMPDAQTAGAQLFILSKRLSEFTKRFKEWLDTPVDGQNGLTHLQVLAKAAGVLARAFQAVVNIGSKVLDVVGHGIAVAFQLLEPVVIGVLNALEKMVTPIEDLGNNEGVFLTLKQAIDNLYTVLKPVVDILGTVLGFLGEIGSFFISMGIEGMTYNIQFFCDAFGLLLELFGIESAQKTQNGIGVLESIGNEINNIKQACADAVHAVKDFFDSLIKDLRTLLGLEPAEGGVEGGFFANVKNFFETNDFLQKARAWIEQAKTDVANWIKNLPTTIGNLYQQIVDAVHGLFYKKAEGHTTATGIEIPEMDVKTPLKKWLDKTKDDVINWITNLPTTIGNLIQQAIDAFNSLFYEKISGVENSEIDVETPLKKWLNGAVESIKYFIASIPSRLSNLGSQLWEAITGLFYRTEKHGVFNHLTKEYDEKTIVIETPLKQWLDGVIDSIKTFIASIPSRLSALGEQLWEALRSLFYKTETYTMAGGGKVREKTVTIETPLKKWLDGVIDSIKAFIASIPSRLSDLGAQLWESITSLFYRTEKYDIVNNMTGDKRTKTAIIETPFKKWLDSIVVSLNNIIKKWQAKLKNFSVVDLFNKVFFKETDKSKMKNGSAQEKTGFAKLLDSIFGAEAVEKARASIESVLSKIEEIFHNFKNTISGIYKDIEGSFQGNNIFETIRSVFSRILNFIVSLFSGTTDAEANISWFGKVVANAIDSIRNKVAEVWPRVKEYIAGIPQKIADFFSGKREGSEGGTSPVIKALQDFGGLIAKFITEDLPQIFSTAFDAAIEFIDGLWGKLYKAIIGDDAAEEATKKISQNPKLIKPSQMKNGLLPDNGTGTRDEVKTAWEKFVESIGKVISKAFEKLPVWIAQGINAAIHGIDWVISNIGNWFKQENVAEKVAGGTDIATEIEEAVAGDAAEGKTEESSGLMKAIAGIGQNILKLFTETIPQFITQGVEWLKNNVVKIGDWLGGIFQGWLDELQKNDNPVVKKIGEIGQKIYNFILKIPEYIQRAFNTVMSLFNPSKSIAEQLLQNFADKFAAGYTGENKIFKSVAGSLSEAVNKESEGTEKTLFEQVIDGVKEFLIKIGEFLKTAGSIVLPYIIDGFAWIVEKSTQILGGFVRMLSGEISFEDLLKEVFGENAGKSIHTALQGLWEKVQGFFNQGVTPFFNNMTGEGGLLAKLFGNMFGSKEENKAAATAAVTEVTAGIDAADPARKVSKVAFKHYKEIMDENSPLRKAINSYRLQLQMGYKDTKFGDVYAAIIAEAKATQENLPDEKETEEANSNLGAVLGFVENIFKTVTDFGSNVLRNPMTGFIAILVLVVVIIDKIRDTIEATNALESMTGTLKQAGITTLIMGITAILGWITYLASQADANDKNGRLQTVMSVFERFANFVLELVKWIAVIKLGVSAISAGKDIFHDIVDLKKAKLPGSGNGDNNDQSNWGEEALGNLAEEAGGDLLGIFTAFLGALVGQGASGALDAIIQSIAGGIEMIGRASASFLTTMKDAFGSVTEAMESVTLAIAVIEATLELFGKIRQLTDYLEDIDTATTMMYTLAPAFEVFYGSLGKGIGPVSSIKALGTLLDMTGKIKDFVDFAEKDDTFDRFKYLLMTLGSALSFKSSGELKDDAAIENATKFLKKILEDDELIEVISNVAPKLDTVESMNLFDRVEQVVLIAGALTSLANAVTGFDSKSATNLNTFFSALQELELPQGTDTEKMSEFSGTMRVISGGIATFSASSAGITEANVKTASLVLNVLFELAAKLEHVGPDFWSALTTGSTTLSEFGLQISGLGQHLVEFMTQLRKMETWDEKTTNVKTQAIEQGLFVLRQVSSIAISLSNVKGFNLTNIFNTLDEARDLGIAISGFIAGLNNDIILDENVAFNIKDANFTAIQSVLDVLNQFSNIYAALATGHEKWKFGDFLKYMSELVDYNNTKIDRISWLGKVIKDVIKVFTEIERQLLGTNIWKNDKLIESVEKGNLFMGIKSFFDLLQGLVRIIRGMHIDYSVTLVQMGITILDSIDAIDALVKGMEQLTTEKDKITNFLDAYNDIGSYNYDNINNAFKVLENVGRMLAAWGLRNTAFSDSLVQDGLTNLLSLSPNDVMNTIKPWFEAIATFIESDDSGIIATISQALAKSLATGIQEAFDNPDASGLQLKITPVLDMDAMKAQLAETVGIGSVDFSELTIKIPQELYDKIDIKDYTSQLTGIQTSINGLNANINQLGNNISSLRLFLDGDTLVGGIMGRIRSGMARDNFMYNRGITPDYTPQIQ